jgi:ABC-type transport system involved in multi-copper enzyme maturation permease subunit
MKTIRSWLIPNPILVKELRSRMRGSRAFITLTIALGSMALMMLALVSLLTSIGNLGGNLLSPQIGQILFQGLVNFELIMVCAITPAITAGALSSEREKLTLEMLLATPLGAARLVWGKLISALSYVFLLIFAAVPLSSLVFTFGGVAPIDLLKALLVLIVVTITLGIYGLFLSALLGRTGRATVISFISVMMLAVGPLVAIFISAIVGNRVNLPRGLLALSPVSMLSSAVTSSSTTNSGSITGLFGFIGGQWDPSMNPIALTQIPRPIYHYSLAIYGALAIILFTLTLALVHPSRRFYLSKRTALGGGAVLAVFAGLITTAFLITAPRYEWVEVPPTPDQPAIGLPARAFPVMASGPIQSGTGTESPLPTPTIITAQGAAMSKSDQIAIYAAAARQVYLKDSTFGSNFPVVYLISITNDRTGDPAQPDAGSVPLDLDLQQGITSQLNDLSARLVWVTGLNEVPKDAKSGRVQEEGLAITFGNIQFQTDGSVQLPASAFISGTIGGGQTYRLQKVDGIWKVTGITGTRWIS